jgi:hypothetical protein
MSKFLKANYENYIKECLLCVPQNNFKISNQLNVPVHSTILILSLASPAAAVLIELSVAPEHPVQCYYLEQEINAYLNTTNTKRRLEMFESKERRLRTGRHEFQEGGLLL